MKTVYLCKSNNGRTNDINNVRNLLSHYDCTIKEFTGGIYGMKNQNDLIKSDILIVCPPKVGEFKLSPPFEYVVYEDIGRGQISQIRDFCSFNTIDNAYAVTSFDRKGERITEFQVRRITSTNVTDARSYTKHGNIYSSSKDGFYLESLMAYYNISPKKTPVWESDKESKLTEKPMLALYKKLK